MGNEYGRQPVQKVDYEKDETVCPVGKVPDQKFPKLCVKGVKIK